MHRQRCSNRPQKATKFRICTLLDSSQCRVCAISTLWEQDGCDKICSKEELWQASQAFEMAIPMKEGDEEVSATESQYEERFWRRRLDGIALDTVNKKCYLIEFKRTRDRRHSYEARAMEVARKQYESLMGGLRR